MRLLSHSPPSAKRGLAVTGGFHPGHINPAELPPHRNCWDVRTLPAAALSPGKEGAPNPHSLLLGSTPQSRALSRVPDLVAFGGQRAVGKVSEGSGPGRQSGKSVPRVQTWTHAAPGSQSSYVHRGIYSHMGVCTGLCILKGPSVHTSYYIY